MENKKKQTLLEILRFLLIGGLATLCDYAVFYLFNLVILKNIDSTLNIIISTFLGFTAGLIFNWIFSAKFVYKYQFKTNKKQFIIYVIICLVGLGITELGMLLAKPTFEQKYLKIIIEFDFWKLFFKCLLTLIVLVWNYLGRKFLVFNEKIYNKDNKKDDEQ